MSRRIAIIQGHPDPLEIHLGHALAHAYADAATAQGHQVRHIVVAQLDCPLLCSKQEWEHGAVPEPIIAAQETIAWAEHLLIVFPLWLGTMPASLKAFLEQVMRPGFAIDPHGQGFRKRLRGRSARVVVTMGMPAALYRWFYFAHGVRGLVRNVLALCGIGPVRTCYVGLVESPACAGKWLQRMRAAGAGAA